MSYYVLIPAFRSPFARRPAGLKPACKETKPQQLDAAAAVTDGHGVVRKAGASGASLLKCT